MNPWLKDGRDPCEKSAQDMAGFFRDWLRFDPEVEEDKTDGSCITPVPVAWEELRALHDAGELAALWLGHASVFCMYKGQRVLFDPVLSERVSPVTFAGPGRFKPPPVRSDFSDWPADLAPNVVAISHAHYDHLDEATVVSLHTRFPDIRWIVPLGLGSWLKQRGINATEMDWWQEVPLPGTDDLALVALPVQHWANRFPWDRNTTLWCGYGVVCKVSDGDGAKQKVPMPLCFLGDTGYCPIFQLLGEKFDIGMALVPIGAYHPRWFMASSHTDPAEAVRIVGELGAKAALAIHWGTYRLTKESPGAQLRDLAAAREAHGGDRRLRAVRPGVHVVASGTVLPDEADRLNG